MVFFELVESLEDYCDTNDIIFVYGSKELQEFHMQAAAVIEDKATKPDQLVLLAGFTDNATLTNSKVTAVQYVGFMSLGRHCENDTSAGLDETQHEKYKRRLSDLKKTLAQIVGEFACANELEVVGNLSIGELLNQFDINMDLAQTNITLSH